MKVRPVDTATLPDDTISDAIKFLAANLRASDLRELKASLGSSWGTEEALLASWKVSTRSALIVDESGLPVGLLGVAPHAVAGLGVAWLVATPDLEKASRSFLRQTPTVVPWLHAAGFKVLFNNVDARNEAAMRWLEWAGFKITGADAQHGPEKRLFLEFTRTA